mgnify:CR=1 FL=1
MINDIKACKEAVGMDTVVGICDATGTLIYVSFNGVDVTGSIQEGRGQGASPVFSFRTKSTKL